MIGRGHNAGMLTGDRVVLRGIEQDDLPRLWELRNDLEVEHRSNDGRPFPTSLAQLRARFDELSTTTTAQSHRARFVIEVSGEVIGQCSLYDFDDYARTCHLGISIRRDRWGWGHGQDAVRVLVRYAFDQLNFRKVNLEVLADDARAVGAYTKAGFGQEGRFRQHAWHAGRYADVLRMAVFRQPPGGPVQPLATDD